MPRTNIRESETQEDDDRKARDRDVPPDRDDNDEYAEPERVSRSGDVGPEDDEVELSDDDIMEELSEDDLRNMEGPDA